MDERRDVSEVSIAQHKGGPGTEVGGVQTGSERKRKKRKYSLSALQAQKWSRLTVLSEYRERDSHGRLRRYFHCRCDCGGETDVSPTDLVIGHVRSCGCLLTEAKRRVRAESDYPMIGKRFDRWTVLAESDRRIHGEVSYWVRCDCGSEREVRGVALRRGDTRSCGCLQREIAAARGRQLLGPLNPNWNPNRTDEERNRDRSDTRYMEWVDTVKDAFAYRCDCCGVREVTMHAHHLAAFAAFPDVRYVPANGVCLCEKCHVLFHQLYGWGATVPAQYWTYKKERQWDTSAFLPPALPAELAALFAPADPLLWVSAVSANPIVEPGKEFR